MKIKVINLVTGKSINFLDQKEIDLKYGVEKVTLDTEDFINGRDLNLLETGGNGGLYGLPTNEPQIYSENFSQSYKGLGNKYSIRTITLTSSIPALILTRNKSLYNYINETLLGDNTVLEMIVDTTNDGGQLLRLPKVNCTSSPLDNQGFEFEFEILGDSARPFKGIPKIVEIGLIDANRELQYPIEYPIEYELGTIKNPAQIVNESNFVIETEVIFLGGTGGAVNVRIKNTDTGINTGYIGTINSGERVRISSEELRVLFEGVSEFQNLYGEFLRLNSGINNLLLETDSGDTVRAFIIYSEVFTSV